MIKQVVSAASVAVAAGILLLAAATTPELVSGRVVAIPRPWLLPKKAWQKQSRV